MKPKEIVNVIRDSGLSDNEIARKTGLSQPTITRIRNGQADVRLSTVNKLMELYTQLYERASTLEGMIMIHPTTILLAAVMTWPTAYADPPAACQPAATLAKARSRLEPLAATVRLHSGSTLAWTVTPDGLSGTTSPPFEPWISRYTEQRDPTQAAAWQALAVELRCQFSTLTVYEWEEPCHNCHEFRVLIHGRAPWGNAGLIGSVYWDS